MSEELTKGLVKKRLVEVGYPVNQDEKVEGIIYYKEDSYKSGIYANKQLADAFLKASKRLTDNEGSPDYSITSDNTKIIIVIECKSNIDYHQSYDDLDDYKKGLGTQKEIENYCINGALHYATYLNNEYDVIAVAASGVSEENYKCTSFLLPRKKRLSDIILLEDGDFSNTLMKLDKYEKVIDRILGENKEENDKIIQDLKSYANSCNNFLRANHISAKDRAGFLSAIVLALTNKDSDFYRAVERAMPDDRIKKSFSEELGNKAIERLKESLEDIWIKKDKLPKVKIDSLTEYYNKILTMTLLDVPEGSLKEFKDGINVLSACAYSIYRNIVLKMEEHKDIDIMGAFYTVFLKYAKGDAKDKGVVLTPKHITELFCDIAEFYLNKKLNEQTKIIDICTGTGSFLISALSKMDDNINNTTISEEEKVKRKEKIRRECLIGVEREPEMFALAYANMRFHGDGKSNLYSCSSLLKDNGVVGEDAITYEPITLQDEIKNMQQKPILGMINPPYSLLNTANKVKKNEAKQTGQSELDFVYSMLEYLDINGVGIAIVPMSCASSKDDKHMRERILEKHTLLATMTMPKKLFQDSKVGIQTCIMVFRAHIKHKDSNNAVFLARWLDDGFITVPHSGRYDKNHQWLSTKSGWLRQLRGMALPNDTIYTRRELTSNDEWLAEAYVSTDYNLLTKEGFESQLKKYALFKYMENNDLGDE